jgi:CrcB protein
MGISLFHILIIALGGAAGGMARFWVTGLVARRVGERFPWGTLVVNVTGSLAIGFLAGQLLPSATDETSMTRLWMGFAVGVLGSYTTVSAVSLQTMVFLRSGQWLRAVANIAGSAGLCLAAAASGYLAGRALVMG